MAEPIEIYLYSTGEHPVKQGHVPTVEGVPGIGHIISLSTRNFIVRRVQWFLGTLDGNPSGFVNLYVDPFDGNPSVIDG